LNVTDVVGASLDEEEAEIMITEEDADYQIMGLPGNLSSGSNGEISPEVECVLVPDSHHSTAHYGQSGLVIKNVQGRKPVSQHRSSSRPCPASVKLKQEAISLDDIMPVPVAVELVQRTPKYVSPYIGEAVLDLESGETVYPCLLCERKYKVKSSLEAHVKVHEGSDNTCPLCTQTMSRSRDLKRHVATVHKGLLHSDGSITYPPDIEQLFPPRRKKSSIFASKVDLSEENLSNFSSDNN